MEKNTARIGTVGKRLLIRLFTVTVTQRLVLLFCCLSAILYGQQNGTFIDLKISDDEFFIGREFEINVLINRDAPYLNRHRDIPYFSLEREEEAVQLLQSSAAPEHDGLHLRYRYRFMQTGRLVFSPVLQWKRQTVTLEPLHFNVHQPPLSEHTAFLWRLYSADGVPIPDDGRLMQGQEYLLCLQAAFYSPGYADRYAQIVQAAAETNTSGAAANGPLSGKNDGGEEPYHTQIAPESPPLPIEILRIDCPAVENAVLQPLPLKDVLSSAEQPFDKAGLLPSDSETDARLHTAIISPAASDEKYTLALFRWIPLQTGMQPLPKAHVFFATETSAASTHTVYYVSPPEAARTAESSIADQFSSAAFAEPLLEYGTSDALNQEETAAAKKIAEYRNKELFSFFPFTVRRERKKQEAALGIVRPLPVYSRIFRLAPLALTVLSAAGALWYRLHNKRRLMLLPIVLTLGCGSVTVMLFRHALQPQGVCIAHNNDAAVRRIPDTSGSTVHKLTIGESVFIVRKTAQWYYIKTVDGISGWVPQQSLMPYVSGL